VDLAIRPHGQAQQGDEQGRAVPATDAVHLEEPRRVHVCICVVR
jgi:hypothetical protein